MNIEQIKEMKAAYEKAMEEHGKDILKQLINEFFEKNPSIGAIKWDQYTPHFNDGEPCQFGLRSVWFKMKVDLNLNGDDSDEDDDSWKETWDFDKQDELRERLETLENQLGELEDLLEATFGDGVTVFAYPDRIETEDCDHD